MPRQTRDQQPGEHDVDGRDWAQLLADAMADMPMDVKTLVERARKKGATFDKTNVSRWLNRKKNPDPDHVVIVAEILGIQPVVALRSARHRVIADAMVEPTEGEKLARIAALDAAIATRVARLKALGDGSDEEDDGDRGAS